MVIDSNNQIAFTNLQSKSFPQAETEPRRSHKGESVSEQEATESKADVGAKPSGQILVGSLSLPGQRCWPVWFPHSPSAGCTYIDQGSNSRGHQRSQSCADPTSCTSSPSQSQDSELKWELKRNNYEKFPSVKFYLKGCCSLVFREGKCLNKSY